MKTQREPGSILVDKGFSAEYNQGRRLFGNVTVAGNDGYILPSLLQKIGYAYNWTLDVALDMADISAFQQQWKTAIPGMAGANGSFVLLSVL